MFQPIAWPRLCNNGLLPRTSRRLFRFKITLRGVTPAIWRRIQVFDDTLDKLHEHIQAGAEGVRTPDLLNAIQEFVLTCMPVFESRPCGGGRCRRMISNQARRSTDDRNTCKCLYTRRLTEVATACGDASSNQQEQAILPVGFVIIGGVCGIVTIRTPAGAQ